MKNALTLTLTPDQLDVVCHALTVLRARLYAQEDSQAPLEAIQAKRRLQELEPVEAVVFAELHKLYEPQACEEVLP